MFLQKPSGFNLIGAVCLGSMQRLLFTGFHPFLSVRCGKIGCFENKQWCSYLLYSTPDWDKINKVPLHVRCNSY